MADAGRCAICSAAERDFKKKTSYPNFFIVHAARAVITGRVENKAEKRDKKEILQEKAEHKKEKKRILQEVEKKVSALRNTDGGVLLLHIDGHKSGDRYTDYFHEFIDKRLQTLIEGGGSYVHTYIFKWLCELQGLSDHPSVIAINVARTNGIVTVDFNTKISSDFEKEQPSTLSLVTLLSRKTYGPNTKPRIRGIDDLDSLHESRNVELKCFFPKPDVLANIERDAAGLVEYIWNDLKLKDNITALSKVPGGRSLSKDPDGHFVSKDLGGGSYYVGIEEKGDLKDGYKTKIPNVVGFELKVKEEHLKESLLQKIATDVCVLNLNGNFDDAPSDLIELAFHQVTSGKYVLEVAVRYFSGIVFCDKQGPRTYVIDGGMIRRMDRNEWFHRIHHRLPAWNT